MKNVIFAMFVALVATVSFTSCGAKDEEITLSDVAGATFKGTDSAKSTYVLTFGNSSAQSFTFTITDDGHSTPDASYTGTYTVVANVVTLNYSSGTTIEKLIGDGAKKLLYSTVTNTGTSEQITLKK